MPYPPSMAFARKSKRRVRTDIERELKYTVVPAKLPPTVTRSRFILQGYYPNGDDVTSLRVIPAKRRASLRKKTAAPGPQGERYKTSSPVSYKEALRQLAVAPTVAAKLRTELTGPDGRRWKYEVFDDGHTHIETEPRQGPEPIVLPPYVGEEHTGEPDYYSVSHAHPRTPAELAVLIAATANVKSPAAFAAATTTPTSSDLGAVEADYQRTRRTFRRARRAYRSARSLRGLSRSVVSTTPLDPLPATTTNTPGPTGEAATSPAPTQPDREALKTYTGRAHPGRVRLQGSSASLASLRSVLSNRHAPPTPSAPSTPPPPPTSSGGTP